MKYLIAILLSVGISISSYSQTNPKELVKENTNELTKVLELKREQSKVVAELLDGAYSEFYSEDSEKTEEMAQSLTKMLDGRFKAVFSNEQYAKFKESKKLYDRVIRFEKK